jgi:carbonic anhydrase/acetyltransferase-like protein (isoleucine patch superfamily)
MENIKSVRGKTPVIGEDCFIAENAVIIGDTTIGDHCSIWYGAVIRGDVNSIKIGDNVNIQDKLILIKSFLNLLEQVSNKIPDIDSLLGAKKNIKNINQG